MKKLFVLLLLLSSGFATAGEPLPFIGKASFAFTDGVCNEHVISIKRNGDTKITTGICSMFKTPVTVYQGKFKQVMPIENTNWGMRSKYVLLFVGSNGVALINKNNNILRSEGCEGINKDNNMCISMLYR